MTPTAASSEAKRDTALVAAVDVAREAVEAEVGASMVGDHLAVVMEDERLATHTFACLNPGYVGWTLGRNRGPGAARQARHGQRGGAAARARRHRGPGVAAVERAGAARATSAPATCSRPTPTTSASSPASPGSRRRSRSTIPARFARAVGAGARPSPRPVALGRDDAADRWVSAIRADDADGPAGPARVPHVRVHAADGGPAGSAVRRVRQRAQPGRRACRGAHLRLRCPLGDRGRAGGPTTATQDETGWDSLELGHS